MGILWSAPPPSAPPPQLQSPFIRLPAELRNRIYHFVLADDRPICPFVPHRKKSCKRPPHPKLSPARRSRHIAWTYRRLPGILRVCQQTRKEGQPIYYGNNVFHLHQRRIWTPTEHWQPKLMLWFVYHPAALEHLRHVVFFDLTTTKWLLDEDMLELMGTGLDKVQIKLEGKWAGCTCRLEATLREKARRRAKRLKISEGAVGLMALVFVEEIMMRLWLPKERVAVKCGDCGRLTYSCDRLRAWWRVL